VALGGEYGTLVAEPSPISAALAPYAGGLAVYMGLQHQPHPHVLIASARRAGLGRTAAQLVSTIAMRARLDRILVLLLQPVLIAVLESTCQMRLEGRKQLPAPV
jgi:hypothetical protein